MDMRVPSRFINCGGCVGLLPVKMTSPTCEDLGIPTEQGEEAGVMYPVLARRVIHNPSLHLDGLRYETDLAHKPSDPYSPLCMIPLPGALAMHTATEPSFIRKRNERERERVRCVNEGYERLKEHLPAASKEKRISKVETLRGAIDYIRELQQMLDDAPNPGTKDNKRLFHNGDNNDDDDDDNNNKDKSKSSSSSSSSSSSMTSKAKAMARCSSDKRRAVAGKIVQDRGKKRRGSLSSEQSVLSDVSESEDEHFLKRPRVQ